MSRRPLSATDRRRQAGHKHPRRVGGSEEESMREENGSGKHLAHLFTDRRKGKNAQGKRAY